jgi:hypothetical protein
LYFFHFGHKLFLLLSQNCLSGFNGLITLLDQSVVLNERLNGKPCAPHTLNEFNPPHIDLVVIPDATFISRYRWNQSNPFIVAYPMKYQTVHLLLRFSLIHFSKIVYHLE